MVVIFVAGTVRRRRGVPWPAVLGLLIFGALAVIAARGVAWWPAIAVVTVAGLLGADAPPAAVPARSPRRSIANAVVGGRLIVAGIVLLPSWRATDPGLGAPSGLLAQAPPGVTAALRDVARPADRVWNPQVWGSWFEFAVPAPAYALDSRVEIFPPETWTDADTVTTARQGWPAILDAAGVTIVVTESATSSPLANALAGAAEWRLAFADDLGTIWVRATK
jgi:hypothetical protein